MKKTKKEKLKDLRFKEERAFERCIWKLSNFYQKRIKKLLKKKNK